MIMNTMFIKIFDNEKEANSFAVIHNAKTIIRYDWDDIFQKIIRQYVVKY